MLDTPLFTERVRLNGLDYGLRFDYSAREGRFYLDISDAVGSAIALGIKVVENWNLLRKVSDSRRPAGELYAWDPNKVGPPDLFDLGRRVRMLYFPAIDSATGTQTVGVTGG